MAKRPVSILEAQYQGGLAQVREALPKFGPAHPTWQRIVVPRDQVFARFQPLLSPDHASKITFDEFRPFLYLEHNHHWSSLYRTGVGALSDIKRFRKALALLVDEGRPLAPRFTEALDSVRGLGKGIASAVLIVAHPDRYGVWNNTSEAGMRKVGLWPEVERGSSSGERYEAVNAVLVRLARDLKIDLWTLDALWWFLIEPEGPTQEVAGEIDEAAPLSDGQLGGEHFALERQLEDFLVENWDRTELGRDWRIYESDGDELAGNQYPTDIGRIDVLAKHKREPRWLVVELKREQTSDQTVGQATRYMGWVKANLAKAGDSVEAILIGRSADPKAAYAASVVPHIRLMRYEVSFRLLPEGKG